MSNSTPFPTDHRFCSCGAQITINYETQSALCTICNSSFAFNPNFERPFGYTIVKQNPTTFHIIKFASYYYLLGLSTKSRFQCFKCENNLHKYQPQNTTSIYFCPNCHGLTKNTNPSGNVSKRE